MPHLVAGSRGLHLDVDEGAASREDARELRLQHRPHLRRHLPERPPRCGTQRPFAHGRERPVDMTDAQAGIEKAQADRSVFEHGVEQLLAPLLFAPATHRDEPERTASGKEPQHGSRTQPGVSAPGPSDVAQPLHRRTLQSGDLGPGLVHAALPDPRLDPIHGRTGTAAAIKRDVLDGPGQAPIDQPGQNVGIGADLAANRGDVGGHDGEGGAVGIEEAIVAGDHETTLPRFDVLQLRKQVLQGVGQRDLPFHLPFMLLVAQVAPDRRPQRHDQQNRRRPRHDAEHRRVSAVAIVHGRARRSVFHRFLPAPRRNGSHIATPTRSHARRRKATTERPPPQGRRSRSAVSVVCGVITSGSVLMWMIAGKPEA